MSLLPKVVLNKKYFAGEATILVSKDKDVVYAQDTYSKAIIAEGADLNTTLSRLWAKVKLPPDHPTSPNTVVNNRIVIKAGWYPLSGLLDFPPLQSSVIDAKGVTTTGAGLRFDSMMDTYVYWGVHSGQTNGVGVEFAPRTAGPDGFKVITCSKVVFTSAGTGLTPPYPSGSSGVKFNAAEGTIVRGNRFWVLGVGGGDFGAYIPNPGAGMYVVNNTFKFGYIQDCNTCLRVGDSSTGRIANNKYRIDVLQPVSGGAGIVTYSQDEVFEILGVHSNVGANKAIVFEGQAQDLIVHALAGAFWGKGLTNNSTGNQHIKVLTPAYPNPSDITVGDSPFTYQNRDCVSEMVIVQAGTVSSIMISRDGVTFYDTGLVSGFFRLEPGDYIKVTYTEAPIMRKFMCS